MSCIPDGQSNNNSAPFLRLIDSDVGVLATGLVTTEWQTIFVRSCGPTSVYGQ